MHVDTLKALADENRLRILNIIVERELCVCEVEEVLAINQSNASRHLNRLRQAGIIVSRKESQWTYYSFDPSFRTRWPLLFAHLLQAFAADESMQQERKRASVIPDKCDRQIFDFSMTPHIGKQEVQF